jgi:calcineurin-like phosphoesterase family protein
MPNVWFTADFHLGHQNIIRYCNRPFDTVEEMIRTILERLNSLVKTNDILYFLGDFCIGSKARAAELRRQIRCKKIFAVPGNHDKDTRKLTQEFSWLGDLAEVSINGQRIVLCHYAMRVWNHSSHGAWHLYGHSHGRLPSLDASLSMDVGVGTHEFRPWHFDEIRDRMKERAASTPGWDESIGRRRDQFDWGMRFAQEASNGLRVYVPDKQLCRSSSAPHNHISLPKHSAEHRLIKGDAFDFCESTVTTNLRSR